MSDDLLDRLCATLGWSRVPEVGALERVADLVVLARAAHRVAVLQPGAQSKTQDEADRWAAFYKALNVFSPVSLERSADEACKDNFTNHSERFEGNERRCPGGLFGHNPAMAGEGCAGCDAAHARMMDKHVGSVLPGARQGYPDWWHERRWLRERAVRFYYKAVSAAHDDWIADDCDETAEHVNEDVRDLYELLRSVRATTVEQIKSSTLSVGAESQEKTR